MSKARVLSYLLDELPRVRSVRSARLHDENTILVKMQLGERIAVYYVESNPSVTRIAKSYNSNTYRDVHTLFIVAADLVPMNGAEWQPGEALRLLLQVQSNRLYVAKVAGQVRISSVFWDEQQRVQYGAPVDLADLSCDYTLVEAAHIQGVRHIADFERSYYHVESFPGFEALQRHPLQQFYDVLGISCDASEDNIKKAYRRKAHENHPDRDPSPDATRRMQAINEAYDQIMKQWK